MGWRVGRNPSGFLDVVRSMVRGRGRVSLPQQSRVLQLEQLPGAPILANGRGLLSQAGSTLADSMEVATTDLVTNYLLQEAELLLHD